MADPGPESRSSEVPLPDDPARRFTLESPIRHSNSYPPFDAQPDRGVGPSPSKPSTDDEPPTSPEKPESSPLGVERLGSHAGAEFLLATTTAPERMAVDALAVGWDQYGPGRLGRWFVEGLDLPLFTGPSQPDEPVFQPLPDYAPPGFAAPRALILCSSQRTVRGEQRVPTVEDTGVAVQAAIRCAQSHGVRSLAVSLLGAGANGLPILAVADAIVSASLIAASGLRGGVVRQITFLAPTEEEAASVRGAWVGFTPEGFANDAASGNDLLGVTDEVYALTEMLLLREVQPPMAVGILGGWGSGKSFAMGLMRRRLTEIRSRTVEPGTGWSPQASSYVGHIYPIDFNAWTYARADLWAALMQTVMQELDGQIAVERLLQEKGELLDGEKWRALIDLPPELRRLYSAVDEDPGAGAPAAAAETELSLFETLRAIHQTDREELAKAETELRSKTAVEDARRNQLTREVEAKLAKAAAARARKQVEAPLTGVMEITRSVAVGWLQRQVPELAPSGKDAQRTLRDLQEASDDLRTVRLPPWRVAVAVFRRDVGPWLVALIAFAASVVLAVVVARAYTLGAVAAVLLAIRPFARGARQVAAEFARQTAAIRERLQVEIDEIEASRDREIAQREATDDVLQAAVEQTGVASLRVESLRARIGLVGEFTSSEDLVRARLEQSTYSSRLGAMQQVSDDLRSLSNSLTVAAHDTYQQQKQELFPRGPARVVLFIDDLDRCPPEKVVEVLEAIQLLLSTGLFVVVVALDVRYVTRALESEYAGVLEAGGEPSGLDYLEKIIQIPYRTRPGLGSAAATYIAGQLRVEGGALGLGAPAEPAGSADPIGSAGGGSGAAPAEGVSNAAEARALTFTSADLEVVAEICRVLRLTPRSAKRVTNIVKLVRLVWARRGRYRPEVDDLATAALMVGLASAHPEWQRRAMRRLSRLGPADAALQEPLIDVLAAFPPVLGGAGGSASHAAWQASIGTLGELRFRRDTEDGPTFARLGGASVAQSMEIVDFVSAFCFVSDSDED